MTFDPVNRRVDRQRREYRQVKILSVLQESQTVSVSELASLMGVSEITLRRDLRSLSEAGVIHRRAGMVEASTDSANDLPLHLRSTQHYAEKIRIASVALALVKNNETIFISGGTTTLELARLLPGKRRVTVVTNSLAVANLLVDKPGINLVVLGGEVRPGEQTMHGHLTEQGAQQLRAGKLFYGVEAISAQHGITHHDLKEVSTDRALADAVEQVIVLADHSKIGKVASAVIFPASRVSVLVTDKPECSEPTGDECFEEALELLRTKGVQIVLA